MRTLSVHTEHHNNLRQLGLYFFGAKLKLKETSHEFLDFWTSLTDEEKRYYRTVDLKTGRPCVEQVCAVI